MNSPSEPISVDGDSSPQNGGSATLQPPTGSSGGTTQRRPSLGINFEALCAELTYMFCCAFIVLAPMQAAMATLATSSKATAMQSAHFEHDHYHDSVALLIVTFLYAADADKCIFEHRPHMLNTFFPCCLGGASCDCHPPECVLWHSVFLD